MPRLYQIFKEQISEIYWEVFSTLNLLYSRPVFSMFININLSNISISCLARQSSPFKMMVDTYFSPNQPFLGHCRASCLNRFK